MLIRRGLILKFAVHPIDCWNLLDVVMRFGGCVVKMQSVQLVFFVVSSFLFWCCFILIMCPPPLQPKSQRGTNISKHAVQSQRGFKKLLRLIDCFTVSHAPELASPRSAVHVQSHQWRTACSHHSCDVMKQVVSIDVLCTDSVENICLAQDGSTLCCPC